jgi:hypothetical protein
MTKMEPTQDDVGELMEVVVTKGAPERRAPNGASCGGSQKIFKSSKVSCEIPGLRGLGGALIYEEDN